MNATASTQRTITSTWQGSDLDTAVYTGEEDYADLLRDAIDAAGRYATRESYSTDEIGQKATHAFVAEYTDPATGQTRYAHYYGDNSGTEHEDYATLADAEAAYEQNVRALQEISRGPYATDEDVWFRVTDVEA